MNLVVTVLIEVVDSDGLGVSVRVPVASNRRRTRDGACALRCCRRAPVRVA